MDTSYVFTLTWCPRAPLPALMALHEIHPLLEQDLRVTTVSNACMFAWMRETYLALFATLLIACSSEDVAQPRALGDRSAVLPDATFEQVAVLDDGTVVAVANDALVGVDRSTIIGLSPNADLLWNRTFASTPGLRISGATPSGSELVFCGYANGSLDLGAGPLVSNGSINFVARINSAGVVTWSERVGDANYSPLDCVGTSDGGAVVVGVDSHLADGPRVWATRIAADGQPLWEQLPTPDGYGEARNVVIDDSGVPLILLELGGGVTVAGTTNTGNDYVLVAADATGNLTTRFHLPRYTRDTAFPQLGRDASGAIYVGGSLDGEGTIGGKAFDTGLEPYGEPFFFAAKLANPPNVEWVQFANDHSPGVMGVSPDGAVTGVGTLLSDVAFGGTEVLPSESDAFLVRVGANGEVLSANGFKQSTLVDLLAVAMSSSAIWVAGGVRGSLGLTDPPIVSQKPDATDGFIVRIPR